VTWCLEFLLKIMYRASVILFMLALPVISVVWQYFGQGVGLDMQLIGKWFLFWGIGGRLLTAGLRQIMKPAFTATEIFHIDNPASYVIVRELGFANGCLGLISFCSLFQPTWRIPAAIAGGLYFGTASFLHVFRKADSINEVIALWSDMFIFDVMLAYVVVSLAT